jgi:hypothetical protein
VWSVDEERPLFLSITRQPFYLATSAHNPYSFVDTFCVSASSAKSLRYLFLLNYFFCALHKIVGLGESYHPRPKKLLHEHALEAKNKKKVVSTGYVNRFVSPLV